MLFAYFVFAVEATELHVTRRMCAYIVVVLLLVLGVLGYCTLIDARNDFPVGSLVTVEDGATSGETIALLEERGIIKSAFVLKVLARITGADRDIHSGRYLFTTPIGAAEVLYRLSHGISGVDVVRVTFPEGITAREMSSELKERLPGFNSAEFLTRTEAYEGYLFPDTYDFYADVSPEEVLIRLRSAFEVKKSTLTAEILSSERSFEDVVIMASLIEREATSLDERRTIAGILWKRLDNDMALQVDAVFGYIKGRSTYSPSLEDLEIESPYNTYRNRGLPPTAISNPGLDSLRAALTPIETPYFYYLTGTDGAMHYAEDFEGHKENRELYLR